MALVEATVCKRLEATYGSRVRLAQRVRLNGSFPGRTSGDGEVLVFALTDHPKECRCYVWEEDGQVHRVLGDDPASDALRAAIEEHEDEVEQASRSGFGRAQSTARRRASGKRTSNPSIRRDLPPREESVRKMLQIRHTHRR